MSAVAGLRGTVPIGIASFSCETVTMESYDKSRLSAMIPMVSVPYGNKSDKSRGRSPRIKSADHRSLLVQQHSWVASFRKSDRRLWYSTYSTHQEIALPDPKYNGPCCSNSSSL